MRFQVTKNTEHSIGVLSNLLLFSMFALIGILVVLVGSKAYQSISISMEENYTGRTALAYTAEKIRQWDVSGSLSFSPIEDINALCLTQKINETKYKTYIYYYDGALRETFVKEDTVATLLQGTPIVELLDFTIEEIEPKLYRLTATEQSGKINTLLVRLRCQ